jgi:hypothetical protein
MEKHHDASIGINWETIDVWVNQLYPELTDGANDDVTEEDRWLALLNGTKPAKTLTNKKSTFQKKGGTDPNALFSLSPCLVCGIPAKKAITISKTLHNSQLGKNLWPLK